MSNPADRSALEEVHRLFTEDCLKLLRGELTEEIVGKDGEVRERVIRASAAEMSVIRAFLKDNDVTAPAAKGTALEALREKMAQRRAQRVPAKVDEKDLGDLGAFGSPMQ